MPRDITIWQLLAEYASTESVAPIIDEAKAPPSAHVSSFGLDQFIVNIVSVCLPACLPVCLFAYLPGCLSVCLKYVGLAVCLPARLSICL